VVKSRIFYTDYYKKVAGRIKRSLYKQPNFLTSETVGSTRGVGDAIQEIIANNIEPLLGNICEEYSGRFARRSMADLAFVDKNGYYYMVDVKTHRLEPGFHMPNLTSVKRLARLYEDDMNYYVILMVNYKIVRRLGIRVTDVVFVPIEFISWSCLTIGALGWGQIQIANAENIILNDRYSRKKWMLEFCDILSEYYPREILKVEDRIDYFKNVKKQWQKKPDIWK